mgnify:FL=1
MRAILESHNLATLKKEISKTNIKGYSKMKKAEVVNLMLKNQDRFGHIKKRSESQADQAKGFLTSIESKGKGARVKATSGASDQVKASQKKKEDVKNFLGTVSATSQIYRGKTKKTKNVKVGSMIKLPPQLIGVLPKNANQLSPENLFKLLPAGVKDNVLSFTGANLQDNFNDAVELGMKIKPATDEFKNIQKRYKNIKGQDKRYYAIKRDKLDRLVKDLSQTFDKDAVSKIVRQMNDYVVAQMAALRKKPKKEKKEKKVNETAVNVRNVLDGVIDHYGEGFYEAEQNYQDVIMENDVYRGVAPHPDDYEDGMDNPRWEKAYEKYSNQIRRTVEAREKAKVKDLIGNAKKEKIKKLEDVIKYAVKGKTDSEWIDSLDDYLQ